MVPFLLPLLLLVELALLVGAYMWLGRTLINPSTNLGAWLVAVGSFLACLATIAWLHLHLAERLRRRRR